MIGIKLENVSKKFSLKQEATTLKEFFVDFLKGNLRNGEIWALRNISLEIKEGECVGIVGENASGKTTLLKIIAGILKPTQGKVWVRGKVAPLLTLGLGFNPELTAKENVYLYASIMGLSKEEIEKRYEKIIEFSELKDFMDVKLKSFSDGMKVRLGFTVAINLNADILLVDEVLTVGDGAFQKKCAEKFEEFKKSGKIVVFVSHSLEFMKKYADKVIWLHQGKIKEMGEPEEVVNSYSTYLYSKHIDFYNRSALETNKLYGIEGFEIENDGIKKWVIEKPTKIKVKIGWREKEPIFLLIMENIGKEIKLITKKTMNNWGIFELNYMPFDGEVNLWVGTLNKFTTGMKPFKLFAKKFGDEKESIFLDDPFSLEGWVILEGECKKLEEKLESECLKLVNSVEEIKKGFISLFYNGKLVKKGLRENVLDDYKKALVENFERGRK